MYAIRIENLGNKGLQKLRNKTLNGWRKETEEMRKCVDRVYVVPDFTQEMCEMNNGKLVETVERIGRRIW